MVKVMNTNAPSSASTLRLQILGVRLAVIRCNLLMHTSVDCKIDINTFFQLLNRLPWRQMNTGMEPSYNLQYVVCTLKRFHNSRLSSMLYRMSHLHCWGTLYTLWTNIEWGKLALTHIYQPGCVSPA